MMIGLLSPPPDDALVGDALVAPESAGLAPTVGAVATSATPVTSAIPAARMLLEILIASSLSADPSGRPRFVAAGCDGPLKPG